MSILHFSHLKRLFCDGPHISHLDSQIVNTSQVTPEDLSVQLTGAGVGRGPCEGGLENPILRTERYHLENTASATNGLLCVSKITDSTFTAETGTLECRMLAQILRTAFSPQFQAVHKIPSGSRSAARKKAARGPLTLFPGQPSIRVVGTPTPYFPT